MKSSDIKVGDKVLYRGQNVTVRKICDCSACSGFDNPVVYILEQKILGYAHYTYASNLTKPSGQLLLFEL